MGDQNQGMTAALLLSVFFAVLIVGLGTALVITIWKRRDGKTTKTAPPEKAALAGSSAGLRNVAFKRPSAWLAIRNKNVLAVQYALSLHDPKPCSWAEGLSTNAGQKLFISPPVAGWILVVGSALPDPNDDVDACFRFLLDLSRKLGHVQCFSANTVLNYHAWAQVDDGRVLRAYAWAGKTLWNQGVMTPAEADLGMKCHAYAEPTERPPFGASDHGASNSDKLHLLAARWSIDPDDLDGRFSERECGIVGAPSRQL
jgi:hypothetical protein